jgi:predicted N-formylglutamate amidohydrolase
LKLLFTCEHGGNRIPARYADFFRAHQRALQSHLGYDAGALVYARELARAFDATLVQSTTSRLLVELNRSPHHPRLFSQFTRTLPADERERIVERYYEPYRRTVEALVAAAAPRRENLLHISCHSFTPRLDGIVRTTDIGLLYDPKREGEVRFSRYWQAVLERRAPQWRVRRNYPYRGSDDGLTAYLRTRFNGRVYRGIEIEVNQKFPLGNARVWRSMRRLLIESLREALASTQARA